ncbi:MAG: winged helix-turn-helix domain-containing protein [Candidatus Hodarchaeales archaeon]|jgi:hypothetical protein
MPQSPGKKKYLSSKALLKGAIRSLLYRYGPLTAKEIQERFGLRQQTTYNYMNELVADGEIEVKYEKLKERANLTRAYYSHKPPLFREQTELSYTDQIVETSQPLESLLEQIKNTSDTNLALILQIKAAINRMTDEEVENYVRCDPDAWGYFSSPFLLTEDEYSELQVKFKELLNRLVKKWADQPSDKPKGNIFTFMFYKTLPFSS